MQKSTALKLTRNLLPIGLFIVLICLISSVKAQESQKLLFTYTAPTTRIDGTALPASEIAGYELSGGGLFAEISKDVIEYEALDYTLPRDGACFSLITKDTSGNRSEPATACIAALPNPPTEFTVTISR